MGAVYSALCLYKRIQQFESAAELIIHARRVLRSGIPAIAGTGYGYRLHAYMANMHVHVHIPEQPAQLQASRDLWPLPERPD